MARQRSGRVEDAVRITSAAPSPQEACFVGAGIAGLAGIDWLWPILIAGALILPYIAVVLANVRATRMEDYDLRDATYTHRALGGSSGDQRPLGATAER